MSSEVFESVNLVYGAKSRTTPESVDFHDCSEDDLDPVQFLSSESPKIYPESSHKDDIKDTNINNSQLFSNPSILSDSSKDPSGNDTNSITFPSKFPNNESTLSFLNNKYSVLFKELHGNCIRHATAVESGDSSLPKLRSMIHQNLTQLSEIFLSLEEIYTSELTFTNSFYRTFQQWDSRRARILNKIAQIKSPYSADGAKLSNLLDQSSSIDEEIEQLNRKIESLKAKKKTIATEIQSTSSVLESRSARYVEMFKNLDNQGRDIIKNYMNMESSGVPQSILTMKPVDVSFVKNYTPIHSRILEPKFGEPEIKAKPITKPTVLNIEGHKIQPNEPVSTSNNTEKSVIGMKPYVIPENETPISKPKEDYKDLNYDHGPSPYEQGYVKGEQSGNSIRNKVQGLIQTVIQTIPERTLNEKKPLPIANFEDASNTISQKLDYDPIRITLQSRIEALTDMVQKVSKSATMYHKYSIVWQDVIKVLKKQETKLQHQISESTTSWNDSTEEFMETLRSTVEQLKTTFELHKFKSDKSDPDLALIAQAISNEIKAICDTLAMVSKNDQYKSLFGEFKSFGFDGYTK